MITENELPPIGRKARFMYEIALHGVFAVLDEDPQAIIGPIGGGQVTICIPEKSHISRLEWFPATPVAIGTMEQAEDFVLGLLSYCSQ